MAEDRSPAAEEGRLTGRVAEFFENQGYGFIKPDQGGSDVFVHHSSIKSDFGFRTLSVGDAVEFSVSTSDGGKTQAFDVTALGGSLYRPSRRLAGGGGGRSRTRNGGAGCYNCGNPSHIARECDFSRIGGGDNGGGGCYNCGGAGHYARDCPHDNAGGGGAGACFNCGEYGHLAKDCISGGGGGGGGGGGQCYNCGGYGHFARDCSSARSGGRFGTGGGCFTCGKPGHIARECQTNA